MRVSDEVVLAIESSCDETAAAVVRGDGEVLSHEILSQKEHSTFGGVVPEIAARAHLDYLHILISQAMDAADLRFPDLNAVAVTSGPGLIGSLIVGVVMAKAIASVLCKPIISVNHLEAHALVVRMLHEVQFPFLLLIISGGHCQFLIAQDVGRYHKLGSSMDDSLGEAFDKTAKMLNLGYPGGPIIEHKALQGRDDRFTFPRALSDRPGCNFSFSGLKTAVRNILTKESIGNQEGIDSQTICDIAASFQRCVGEILVSRLANAIAISRSLDDRIKEVVITGGVAANIALRKRMSECVASKGLSTIFPPKELCTDNAIMVGWAGIENLRKGNISSTDFAPRARWPLEEMSSH